MGQASNGAELIELVSDTKPDVVITDIQMPVMNGIEATKILSQRFPDTGVIALSMSDHETFIVEMMEAGAKGYLLKTTSEKEVVYAVQTVQAKGTYYCSSSSNKLIRVMANNGCHPYKESIQPKFSDKEVQIIRLICQEKCSKEISAILNINQRAVDSARERIQEKTCTKNMVGIAMYAVRNGMFYPK